MFVPPPPQWSLTQQQQQQQPQGFPQYGVFPPPPPSAPLVSGTTSFQPVPFENVKSLWVGDIQSDWSEEYVSSQFASTGKSFRFRLVRDRATALSSGYGFLEFESHADAEEVLRSYSGRLTLRWGGGHGRTHGTQQQQQQNDCSVFVGDLDYSTTEEKLLEPFREKYKSAVSARIVVDAVSGISRGFGFVKFGAASERDSAVAEMNGFYLGGRQIRVMTATSKEERENISQQQQTPTTFGALPERKGAAAAENSCVFVGGLDESVTPEMLRHHFGLLGDIAYIRIPQGRGCGFVGFVHRKNAEAAISTLQGLRINGYKVRLSWGSMRHRQQSSNATPMSTNKHHSPMNAPQKSSHRTPFGSVTQDYLDALPELATPWQLPTRHSQTAVSNTKREANLVPASPYVAQLKARYQAYRDSSPSSREDEEKNNQKKKLRRESNAYSFYSARTSRPTKRRPMTAEEIETENELYVDFLSETLPILNSGIVLPTGPTPSISDLYHDNAIADTDMAFHQNQRQNT